MHTWRTGCKHNKQYTHYLCTHTTDMDKLLSTLNTMYTLYRHYTHYMCTHTTHMEKLVYTVYTMYTVHPHYIHGETSAPHVACSAAAHDNTWVQGQPTSSCCDCSQQLLEPRAGNWPRLHLLMTWQPWFPFCCDPSSPWQVATVH